MYCVDKSARCAELAASACTKFVISSCTSETWERNLATTEARTSDLCSYGACISDSNLSG